MSKLRLVPLWIVASMASDLVILPAWDTSSHWDSQQIKLQYNKRDKERTETEVVSVSKPIKQSGLNSIYISTGGQTRQMMTLDWTLYCLIVY